MTTLDLSLTKSSDNIPKDLYPNNLDNQLISICKGCTTKEAVLNKLKRNPENLIQFFACAINDKTWMEQSGNVVQKIIRALELHAIDGALHHSQALRIHTISREILVRSLFQQTITLKTNNGKELVCNKAALISASPYFNKMLSGTLKESTQSEIEFKEVSDFAYELLDDYLKKEKLSNRTLHRLLTYCKGSENSQRKFASSLIATAEIWLMPSLIEMVLPHLLNEVTIMHFLMYAYNHRLGEIRDTCFHLINQKLEHIEIQASDFKNLTIKITGLPRGMHILRMILTTLNENDNPQKAFIQFGHRAWKKPKKVAALIKEIKPTHLEARGCSEYTWKAIVSKCGSVKILDLATSSINDDGLAKIAQFCHQLRYLNLQHCHSFNLESLNKLIAKSTLLRTLDLSYTACNATTLKTIATSCPRIQSLKLHGCQNIGYKDLVEMCEELNKDKKNPLDTLILFPGLVRLPQSPVYLNDEGLSQLALASPNLRHLSLQSIDAENHDLVTGEGVRAVLKHCIKMETLSLYKCYSIKGDILGAIAEAPSLKTLIIDGNLNFTSRQISKIAKCHKLESISLLECTMKSETVLEIAKGCPHLSILKLHSLKYEPLDRAAWNALSELPDLQEINLTNFVVNDDDLTLFIKKTRFQIVEKSDVWGKKRLLLKKGD